METVLALLTGFDGCRQRLLMLSKCLVRFIFGLVLASNAVNLLIFAAGRPDTAQPPLIPDGLSQPATVIANSLPQALILTAIVIGFAILVFVFILFFRAYETLGTINTEFMTAAEDLSAKPSPQNEGQQ
jgi:multicomponent Na+:H+ antiporter subunit C